VCEAEDAQTVQNRNRNRKCRVRILFPETRRNDKKWCKHTTHHHHHLHITCLTPN